MFKIADNASQNKEKISSRMSFSRNDGRDELCFYMSGCKYWLDCDKPLHIEKQGMVHICFSGDQVHMHTHKSLHVTVSSEIQKQPFYLYIGYKM